MTNYSELRTNDRAAITLRVDYRRINTFFSDYTKNISKGGTFIRTTKPLPVGTQFIFHLGLPGDAGELDLQGEVMWVVKRGEAEADDSIDATVHDEAEGMGIRFLFRDDSERQRVEDFVERLMVETLGEHISQKLMQAAKKPNEGER